MRGGLTRTVVSFAVLALVAGVLVARTGNAETADTRTEKCLSGTLENLDRSPNDRGDKVKIATACTVPAGNYSYRDVTIMQGGSLIFSDAPIRFEVASIVVEDGGSLAAGTKGAPIGTQNGRLQMVFLDLPPTSCDAEWCGKGILVKAGGRLSLVGVKGVPDAGVSWTHLAAPAGPATYGPGTGTKAPVPANGARVIQLAKDVTQGPGAWESGDWIAVATTSYSPFETEFVQIDGAPTPNGAGGSQVKLVQPLRYYHFGGADPGLPGEGNFRAGPALNYGVDERAEVGLITRRITLTAEIGADPHAGGEIKILKGFAEVVIQGVELEKFGKAQLGRYPIHLHEIGLVTQPLTINANSVHHSFNKCVTIHSTSQVTIENNVCARIVGHIFYQEIGDEENITFRANLGLGAMSNSFDIHGGGQMSRQTLIDTYWWAGDNLARSTDYRYDGLNVPNRDNQQNPTHGACATVGDLGQLLGYPPPPCTDKLYVEPASGFWLINPATTLEGNSIGGCQGVGVGYWYVAPSDPSPTAALFRPLGTFKDNRVHGCYSGVYNEALSSVTTTGQFHPHVGGTLNGKPVIATLDGVIATRNRSRGIWLRPTWIAVVNARLATNRENVTLVSSGGSDGNAPGVWQMLRHGVVVGLSQNNVDRFGPCPGEERVGNPSSGRFGCIDQTLNPTLQQGGDETGRGYPDPTRNFFGYMLYDGPVLVFDTRFVNFNVNIAPHLTESDRAFLKRFSTGRVIPSQPPSSNAFVYEGDAAFGWFQANQSAYPTATSSHGLVFDNVDLRHQIYTHDVNIDKFQDGDKNTALLDLDGSLTGLKVVDAAGQPVPGAFPVSLNNLPFHHYGGPSGGSVDECAAEGEQNARYEGRPTSLISPGSVGTLEFSALFPEGAAAGRLQPNSHWQVLTFKRDSREFVATPAEQHPAIELTSRNGLGVWEPKVTSGHGYTVSASPLADPPPPFCQCGMGACAGIKEPGNPDPPGRPACLLSPLGAGIPRVIDVGVADVVKPGIEPADPFQVRLGICYTSEGGGHPRFNLSDPKGKRGLFTITRGYKSYGQLKGNEQDEQLRLYWNKLFLRYQGETCHNLDDLERNSPTEESRNLNEATGCPAHGVSAVPPMGCPVPSTEMTLTEADPDHPGQTREVKACIHPKSELELVERIEDLTANGVPDLDKYFYDEERGLLFFHVAQEASNAPGPSPLGSCTGGPGEDASCPRQDLGESYYSCPAQGCTVYIVRLNDPDYRPAPSNCEPYGPYVQEPPAQKLFLAEAATGMRVERAFDGGRNGQFPHWVDRDGPLSCR